LFRAERRQTIVERLFCDSGDMGCISLFHVTVTHGGK